MNLSEAVKKFAATIGINVSEFNADEAVLQKASDVIGKLKEQFSDDPDCIKSLELYVSKFSKMPEKIKELEQSVEKYESERSEILVQGAIDSHKITPAEKDTYLKLAKGDYDTTREALASRKPADVFAQNVVSEASTASGNGSVSGDEKAKWSFSDWSKNDPAGLKNMKSYNFSEFKELFKKEYNEEYAE